MNKISIVIPIYNSESYIKRCLDSILNQTYKNIEVICVNDGSIDKSLNLLKSYQKKDKRVIIIDKKNEGVSAARNDGIKKSSGDYITFVDADDWLEKDAIETLYNVLKETNVDVVRGNYYLNYDEDKNSDIGNLHDLKNKMMLTSDEDFGTLIIDRLINGEILSYVWLLLVKKEVLNNITFKKDVKFMEDAIFYFELFNQAESIFFLDKPTYHYFVNYNSCTKSTDYFVRNMYNIIDVNKYLTSIIKNSKFNLEYRLTKLNSIHVQYIMNYFFDMYKMCLKDKNEIIYEIEKLLENKDFVSLFEKADLNTLAWHLKTSAKLIYKKKYKKLFIFYKFRNLMSKTKDVLLHRK